MCNILLSLRYKAYYIDTFTYCNMIDDIAVFITLHDYRHYTQYYCLYLLYALDLDGLLTTHFEFVPLTTIFTSFLYV